MLSASYSLSSPMVLMRARHISGNYLAAAITTESAKQYLLLRQTQGATDGTIVLELAILKRSLNLANRATPPKIARVPYIQMPRAGTPRTGFIERDGYTRLLAALPEYLRPVVTMAYCTGMRRGGDSFASMGKC